MGLPGLNQKGSQERHMGPLIYIQFFLPILAAQAQMNSPVPSHSPVVMSASI